MNFEEALEALITYRNGGKIRRGPWGLGVYFNDFDVMAEDWEVMEEPKPPKLMAPCLYRYDVERDTVGWVRVSNVVFDSLEEAKMTYPQVIQWPAIPDAKGFYSVPQE